MSEAIDEIVWARLEAEFTLPSLEDVQARMAALHHDPPVVRQLVRIFVRDGTYCPGFQFRPDGSLHPAVIDLSERAMALRIPHNFFAAWMITPLGRNGVRPVDALDRTKQVAAELEAFARNITPLRHGTSHPPDERNPHG